MADENQNEIPTEVDAVETEVIETEVTETEVTEAEESSQEVEKYTDQSDNTSSDNEDIKEHNKQGYDKRRKYKSALEENERLKQQMAQMMYQVNYNQQPVQPQVQPQVQHVDPNAEPDINNYSDTNKYLADRVKYEARVLFQEQEKIKQQNQISQNFAAKCEEYAKTNSDFYDDVTYSDVSIRDDIQNMIINSDKGPMVAHTLAKDTKLAQRLNNMDPLSVMRELVLLEQTLEAKPSISKAPAPISKMKQKEGSAQKDLSDLSMNDYMKVMNGFI